jgi:hypothetical protein
MRKKIAAAQNSISLSLRSAGRVHKYTSVDSGPLATISGSSPSRIGVSAWRKLPIHRIARACHDLRCRARVRREPPAPIPRASIVARDFPAASRAWRATRRNYALALGMIPGRDERSQPPVLRFRYPFQHAQCDLFDTARQDVVLIARPQAGTDGEHQRFRELSSLNGGRHQIVNGQSAPLVKGA